MKKLSKNSLFNYLIVVLCALTVFVSVLSFTGAWFTDYQTIKGNLSVPAIKPVLVNKSGSSYVKIEKDSLTWSTTTDFNEVYIQFPASSNNIKYVVARFFANITWGTIVDGEFVEDKELNQNNLAVLTPTFSNESSWTKGVANSRAKYEYLSAHSGYTVEELQNMNLSDTALEAFLGIDTNNIPTYYYYNDIINLETQTSPISIISGFTFTGDSGAYAGKVAKINLTIEAASISDKTLGGTENGVAFEGMWTNTTDDANRATDDWVARIKSQRDLLV